MIISICLLIALAMVDTTISGSPVFAATRTLYDNFDTSVVYTLTDGQTSPNGKWFNKYSGYGSSGTMLSSSATSNEVYYEKPQASKSPDETHSSLTLSTTLYRDLDVYLDVRTKEQLRRGSLPNPWEAAWITWRYQDDWHHYYFIFKPNGIELGKRQNDIHSDSQIFLFTAPDPKMKLEDWNIWHIKMTGNLIEISLKIAGKWQKVVDFADPNPLTGPGKLGLYTEDAYVQFDNICLTPTSK
jgi:hypothetical protein